MESFKAKGLVYRGALDFYDKRVPGGVEAVGHHLPDDLRSFLRQHFLPGGWYDALPIFAISRAAAQACAITHPQLVRENAAWVARRDIHGVYKFILRLTSPEAVVVRLPRASMQYFDFGTAEAKVEAKGHCAATQDGIPEVLGPWFAWAAEGFIPIALVLAGAKDVVVESSVSPGARNRGNARTSQVALDIRWA